MRAPTRPTRAFAAALGAPPATNNGLEQNLEEHDRRADGPLIDPGRAVAANDPTIQVPGDVPATLAAGWPEGLAALVGAWARQRPSAAESGGSLLAA